MSVMGFQKRCDGGGGGWVGGVSSLQVYLGIFFNFSKPLNTVPQLCDTFTSWTMTHVSESMAVHVIAFELHLFISRKNVKVDQV